MGEELTQTTSTEVIFNVVDEDTLPPQFLIINVIDEDTTKFETLKLAKIFRNGYAFFLKITKILRSFDARLLF